MDDIAYKNKVFPVIAGQVGVSCCKRVEKEMKSYDFDRRLVITLPKVASQSDWNKAVFFNNLDKIIYVFLTIFLYLLKCPQSLILSALRVFCFCGKPHISRLIFLYFLYQTWLKSW